MGQPAVATALMQICLNTHGGMEQGFKRGLHTALGLTQLAGVSHQSDRGEQSILDIKSLLGSTGGRRRSIFGIFIRVVDDRNLTCHILKRSRRALVMSLVWLLTPSILVGCSEPATGSSLVMNGVEIPPTLSDISSFQQDLLEDGDLTFSEYERAVFATVDCLVSEGFDVSGVRLSPFDGDTYEFSYSVPGKSLPDAARVAADRCFLEYLDTVDLVWAGVNRSTESELAEQDLRLRQCLSDLSGIAAESLRDAEQLREVLVRTGEEGAMCVRSSVAGP